MRSTRSATFATRRRSSLAERVYSDVGPVRLLVNNAGVEQFGYLGDTRCRTGTDWCRSTSAVSSTAFGLSYPRMLASDAPSWVWNLSSIGGVAAVPLQAPYIAEQARGAGLDQCLRLEVDLVSHAIASTFRR